MTDKVQMEQVALNLMLNAVTAMQSTPGEDRALSVSIAADAPGRPAQVSVADSGKGIEVADLDKVFEPFWTTTPEGLGLGLAICRSIIEAHGGEIEVAPNAGRGVTFRFTLPRLRVEAGAEQEPHDVKEGGRRSSTSPGRASTPLLALIDDDFAVREGIARLLSTTGWTVRAFASAEAFLEQRNGLDVGCLLLDIRMDGRSGLRLYESLCAEGSAPPVVFLSGHGDVATSVEAMKLGAVEFLEKPVAKDQLFAAVDRALTRHAEQRAQARERDAARSRIARLSPREQDVMTRVIRGRLNKQIAAELGISEQTVKQHRGRVMEKLDAGSVAELVRLCELSGLFQAQ
jgi:FixJ family two-component response regulator